MSDERLSKQQKKILKYLEQRRNEGFTTPLARIKYHLWGKEDRLKLEGRQLVIVGCRLPICKGGNNHFSVKRSMLNLMDKELIDMEYENPDIWTKAEPYFFLTEKGTKCVEKITTQ